MREARRKLDIIGKLSQMGMGFESLRSVAVERNEGVLKEDYGGERLINESLNGMSEELLDFVSARFISNFRREDGKGIQGRLYMK